MDWIMEIIGRREATLELWALRLDAAIAQQPEDLRELLRSHRPELLAQLWRTFDPKLWPERLIARVQSTGGRVTTTFTRADGWSDAYLSGLRWIEHGILKHRIAGRVRLPDHVARVHGGEVAQLAVSAFGAVGDAQTDDTEAFQDAIDQIVSRLPAPSRRELPEELPAEHRPKQRAADPAQHPIVMRERPANWPRGSQLASALARAAIAAVPLPHDRDDEPTEEDPEDTRS